MSNKGFAADGLSKLKFEKTILNIEQREDKEKARRKRYTRRHFFLRNHIVECELFKNEFLFGTVKKMTATQMANENARQVRRSNKKADDGDKDPVLWRWKIKDYKEFNRLMDKAATDF